MASAMSNRDKRNHDDRKPESSTHCNVHLESVAQIDFVESVKKAQSDEHDDSFLIQKWQVGLAIGTMILLFITAGLALWQSVSSQASAGLWATQAKLENPARREMVVV
jgi:hypothetical protein